MAKRLQHRGGTTSQHSTFTGAVREVTVDTDKNTLVVHDGATAGGHPLATATNFTSTGIDDNATSTAITIDAFERVGIGTSSPEGKLHILRAGGTNPANYLLIEGSPFNNATYPGIQLRGGTFATTYPEVALGNGGLALNLTNGYSVTYPQRSEITASNGGVILRTSSTGTALERMRIDSSGNVGIGTSSPSDTLHASRSGNSFIQSNTTSTSGIGGFRALNNSSTEIKLFSYGTAYSGSTFGGVANANLALLESQSASNVVFSTWSNAGGSNPDFIFAPQRNQKVIIKSDGKVGIGTSSPYGKFEVHSGGGSTNYTGSSAIKSGVTWGSEASSHTIDLWNYNEADNTSGMLLVHAKADSNKCGTLMLLFTKRVGQTVKITTVSSKLDGMSTFSASTSGNSITISTDSDCAICWQSYYGV